MKTKTDTSYGVIPYIYEAEALKFFLVYQHSAWRGDTYWVFPKGHPEEGEMPEETALRELKEEAQILLESLDTEHPFNIAYSFMHEDTQIQKSVTFFLGKAASKEFVLDGKEVVNAGWFSSEEARSKVTHENTKEVLNDVVAHLSSTEFKQSDA